MTHGQGAESWRHRLTPGKVLRIAKALCLQDDAAAPSSARAQERRQPGSPAQSLPSRSSPLLPSAPRNVPGSAAGFAFSVSVPQILSST